MDRPGLRYPSDLTGAQWVLVAPLIWPAKHGGRPREVDVRKVMNAVFYVLPKGRHWSALPKDLPPKNTVWDYFSRCEWGGTVERIHHALFAAVREQAGGEASPTAAIIDSQTAKAAQKSTLRSTRPATTQAIEIVGRKRHLLTDIAGMLLAVIVHPASMQDRDGAEPLLRQA